MHHDHVRYPHDTADRCDVPNKIETEVCVECGVNRIRGANLQKRIAIGVCLHDRFGGDIAGSPRPVLDYELLAKSLRQPLTHEACHDVGSPASRKADDDAHRPRRYIFCKQLRGLALSTCCIPAHWRQKLFPASVKLTRARLCCRDGGDPMSTSPIFVATFADKVCTRMSINCTPD